MMSLFLGAEGILHSFDETLMNNIICKRFGLTKAEASGLTYEHKSRLLESTFSEEYITRFTKEELIHFFTPFKDFLHHHFPSLAAGYKKESPLDDDEDSFDFVSFYLSFLPISGFLTCVVFSAVANILFPSSQHGVVRLTNDAAQGLSQSSFGFSCFLEDLNTQGLEGINEN